MPRLSVIRISALDDLARQLRFAPRGTILRQLRHIIELAREIDTSRNYPQDWVINRITGFRPEMEPSVILVGQALLADLSPLAERLSDGAGLLIADLDIETMSLAELRDRWSISARTIERRRRLGLIALRVRDDACRVRLAFAVDSVRLIEERGVGVHAKAPASQSLFQNDKRRTGRDGRDARPTKARSHSERGSRRLDRRTQERLYAIAKRGSRRFGWSLHETSRRLALRTGRGRSTMRELLLRIDNASSHAFFTHDGSLTPAQRRAICESVRAGEAPSGIAKRYGRSRSAITRAVNERRAELLRRLGLTPAPPDEQLSQQEIEAILSPASVCEGLEAGFARTAAAFVAAATADDRPDAIIEREIGLAHRLLLERAGSTIESLTRFSPSSTALDRAETDLRWAALLRAKLVRSLRRLAMETIQVRCGSPMLELPAAMIRELHGVAMGAAIDVCESFDPRRGGRLSAAAAITINKRLAQTACEQRPPELARAMRSGEVELDDWTQRLAPWMSWLAPDPALRAEMDSTDERATKAMRARYGWDGMAPRTAVEVASSLSMTLQGLAAMERAALKRGRQTMGDDSAK